MTQELACLLIGLGMMMIGVRCTKIAGDSDNPGLLVIGAIGIGLGVLLIGFPVFSYISSLPSIKEAGR